MFARSKIGRLVFTNPSTHNEIQCELHKVKGIENAYRINDTNTYIHSSLVRKGPTGNFELLKHHDSLSKLLTQGGASGNLFWYRGMPGCHWKWDNLRGNMPIHSEGYDPSPQYTMDSDPTRKHTSWLPGELDRDVCEMAAVQCLADVAPPDDIREDVPVGAIMRVQVSDKKEKTQLCIMPGSEIQLKGPAMPGDYERVSILILRNFNDHTNTLFLCPNDKLPPSRPFFDEVHDTAETTAIKEGELQKWYEHIAQWQNEVLPTLTPCEVFVVDPGIAAMAQNDTVLDAGADAAAAAIEPDAGADAAAAAVDSDTADERASESVSSSATNGELLMPREKFQEYKATVANNRAPPVKVEEVEVKVKVTSTIGITKK